MRSGRVWLFPWFQFADGHPRPVIKDVLFRLPNNMTPWPIAFWFRSRNGWLDGRSPEEAMSNKDAVLAAADRLGEQVVG